MKAQLGLDTVMRSNPWAIYFYVNTHTCICEEFGINLSSFSRTIVSNFVSYVCPASRQAVSFWSSNAVLYCLNIPAQWLGLIFWCTRTMAGSIGIPAQWQCLILVRGLSRKWMSDLRPVVRGTMAPFGTAAQWLAHMYIVR